MAFSVTHTNLGLGLARFEPGKKNLLQIVHKNHKNVYSVIGAADCGAICEIRYCPESEGRIGPEVQKQVLRLR
jgi:hypothetical protein